jgi:hypothetical protein
MLSLKLISHITINQLHYQVHKPSIRVLFLNITLCLEGFRFESEKKNLTKGEDKLLLSSNSKLLTLLLLPIHGPPTFGIS